MRKVRCSIRLNSLKHIRKYLTMTTRTYVVAKGLEDTIFESEGDWKGLAASYHDSNEFGDRFSNESLISGILCLNNKSGETSGIKKIIATSVEGTATLHTTNQRERTDKE